jgi:hypothetical protein
MAEGSQDLSREMIRYYGVEKLETALRAEGFFDIGQAATGFVCQGWVTTEEAGIGPSAEAS